MQYFTWRCGCTERLKPRLHAGSTLELYKELTLRSSAQQPYSRSVGKGDCNRTGKFETLRANQLKVPATQQCNCCQAFLQLLGERD
eukprot:1604614-Amphidinium_carterae.1